MKGTTSTMELVTPDRRTRFPIALYTGFSANGGEFEEGDGSVTLDLDLLTLPDAFVSNPYGWSIDYFWWAENEARPTKPRFSGCVTSSVNQMQGGRLERVLTLEAFKHHLLRRRLAVYTDFVPFQDLSNTIAPLTWADAILNMCIVIAPSFPTGRMTAYPGARTDYGFWTCLRIAAATALRSPQFLSGIQSASNAWDALTILCRETDLWLECTETDDAEWSYQLSEGYEFLRAPIPPDPSHTAADMFTMSDTTGVLAYDAGRVTTEYRGLANRYVSLGKGQGSATDAQYGVWYQHDDSVDLFGAFEDAGLQPNGTTSLSALAFSAKSQADLRATPKVTVEMVVQEMPFGWMFGVDWGVRDKVRIHHSRLLPTPEDLIVRGWAINQNGEGAPVGLQLTLGDAPYRWAGHLRDAVGDMSGRSAGGFRASKAR